MPPLKGVIYPAGKNVNRFNDRVKEVEELLFLQCFND